MKYICIHIIITISLILFYQRAEPFILLNELNNSIFINTHNLINTQDIYNIVNIKIETSILTIENKEQLNNTEYLIVNKKTHKNTSLVFIFGICIILIAVLVNTMNQLFLYKHELKALTNKTLILIITILSIHIYVLDLLTNNILKKNINNTEILYNTNYDTAEIVIITICVLILYNVQQQYNLKKNRRILHKSTTRIAVILMLIATSMITTQYSLYETLSIIILIEITQQMINMHRNLHRKNEIA